MAAQEVLHRRSDVYDLGILVIQAIDLCQQVSEDERYWQWRRYEQQSFAPDYRYQVIAEAIRGRGTNFLGEGDIP